MADIIFIPGFWHSEESSLSLRQHFEESGYRFHTAPVLGHRSLKRRVRSIEAFILNERFDSPPIVIGHGMGGLIAQQVCAGVDTGPLILVNSLAPGRRPAQTVMDHLRLVLFSAPGRDATPLAGWRQSCLELIRDVIMSPQKLDVDAESIISPILILSGERDNLISPKTAVLTFDHYPQADFHQLAGQDHWMLENTYCEPVFNAMSDWLSALDIETDASTFEELSVEETRPAHHELPSIRPSQAHVDAAKRGKSVPASARPANLRHPRQKGAAADQETVLPR